MVFVQGVKEKEEFDDLSLSWIFDLTALELKKL